MIRIFKSGGFMADLDNLYYLLKNEQIDEFNSKVDGLSLIPLQNLNLRFINLQKANLRYADLRGAYMSRSDLRGVNLTNALLEGSSFHSAKISGTYFPKNLSAEEIKNSVMYGTRVRTTDTDAFNDGHLIGKSESK